MTGIMFAVIAAFVVADILYTRHLFVKWFPCVLDVMDLLLSGMSETDDNQEEDQISDARKRKEDELSRHYARRLSNMSDEEIDGLINNIN